MTIASAIADLEQARAERQKEIYAIDVALRELRTIRSNREGLSPSSPAHLPGTKDAPPVFPQASSLPVRPFRGSWRERRRTRVDRPGAQLGLSCFVGV